MAGYIKEVYDIRPVSLQVGSPGHFIAKTIKVEIIQALSLLGVRAAFGRLTPSSGGGCNPSIE